MYVHLKKAGMMETSNGDMANGTLERCGIFGLNESF